MTSSSTNFDRMEILSSCAYFLESSVNYGSSWKNIIIRYVYTCHKYFEKFSIIVHLFHYHKEGPMRAMLRPNLIRSTHSYFLRSLFSPMHFLRCRHLSLPPYAPSEPPIPCPSSMSSFFADSPYCVNSSWGKTYSDQSATLCPSGSSLPFRPLVRHYLFDVDLTMAACHPSF